VKRTHKLKVMSAEVAAVLAAVPNVSAASRRLQVARSTIYRWRRDGKVPRPGRSTPRAPVADPAPTVPDLVAPEDWASWAAQTYELDPTATMLVTLAVEALTLARDTTAKPADRLAGMGRFQGLVKQLNFEDTDANEATAAPRRYPRPV
jgi:transposase-like protein